MRDPAMTYQIFFVEKMGLAWPAALDAQSGDLPQIVRSCDRAIMAQARVQVFDHTIAMRNRDQETVHHHTVGTIIRPSGALIVAYFNNLSDTIFF